MNTLSAEGRRLVDNLAQTYGFSPDAVETLLRAVAAGNGFQAQFNHYEFGGMGQWSQGGMIMIGDMFNNGLKDRVARLCADLASALRDASPFAPVPAQSQSQSQSQGGYVQSSGTGGGLFTGSSSNWWPAELGMPSSSGGQNDMRYAVFPGTRRLAVQQGGQTKVYDTGNHQIGGVSQQQGADQSLVFTSQFGNIRADDLPLDGVAHPADSKPNMKQAPIAAQGASSLASSDDVVMLIERLHDLNKKGILSDEEYAHKKGELLSRI